MDLSFWDKKGWSPGVNTVSSPRVGIPSPQDLLRVAILNQGLQEWGHRDFQGAFTLSLAVSIPEPWRCAGRDEV